MARITTEDCQDRVNDRFELIVLAARRAKELNRGSKSYISEDKIKNDKESIISLREMAAGKLDNDKIRSLLVKDIMYEEGMGAFVETKHSDTIEKEVEEQIDYLMNDSVTEKKDTLYSDVEDVKE
jgi:DNA-directed RNA polymerase subunit omega